jgi:L-amino acid N-acyltransferase YncA
MSVSAVQPAPELFKAFGEDGIEYSVRPFRWTFDRAEQYFREFVKYHIFTDDVPKTIEAFLATMGNSIWFEMVNEATEEGVAFMYLTDFQPSLTEKRFLSATFHAVTWDAKAAPRRGIAQRFIQEMFTRFKLHRMQAAVPLNKGGAIRTLHKMGFKDEGVMRQSVRYGGKWFDVLLLSILEHEVSNGNGS